jgi:hypothetical protein
MYDLSLFENICHVTAIMHGCKLISSEFWPTSLLSSNKITVQASSRIDKGDSHSGATSEVHACNKGAVTEPLDAAEFAAGKADSGMPDITEGACHNPAAGTRETVALALRGTAGGFTMPAGATPGTSVAGCAARAIISAAGDMAANFCATWVPDVVTQGAVNFAIL